MDKFEKLMKDLYEADCLDDCIDLVRDYKKINGAFSDNELNELHIYSDKIYDGTPGYYLFQNLADEGLI